MGKRNEAQRRDDSSSSSSDAKRRRSRHHQNGQGVRETSRPNDGMPRDVLCDAVIELKDAILVKLSTEERFKRKFEKLKEKRKKDKNKHEEDLKILKEEFRILKEGHEDLKSKFQEMRKEGCAEVDHYRASPSQRSQLSQSTRFRLVIENSVSKTIYKKEIVEAEDGGRHITVVMYDGANPIASEHPLASAKVDLIVIEGCFNEPKRKSWSKEEFEKSIIKPRKGITRLVENGTFHLIRGRRDHEGAIIMDNSQQREVKLGVMIAVHAEERVLEGVSNPFKVQEGKTKKSQKKSKQPSPPIPTPILGQSTSAYSTQHGQGPASLVCQQTLPPPLQKGEEYRLSHPPPTMPLMVEGNGRQGLNGNGQCFPQEILAQIVGQSTSGYAMQHGQVYSLATPSIQNQLASVPGYFPVNQPLLARGQDQYTTSLPSGSSELAHHNPSNFELLKGTQSTFNPEDVPYLNAQTQLQESYGSFRCGQALLQWDNPHVELGERWNFFDQLMPLYSSNLRIYGESFPSTSLMDKAQKLLGSTSSVGSVWKKEMTSVTSRSIQNPQRRGVLIRPIDPDDSDDEPPFKRRRNPKYRLRFVNRVCNDYYTREQIKSEDGTFLKVALYDENNLVVTSGPLSSASVEVVLLHGDFNAEGQDYWTPEEFSIFRVHKDGVFYTGEVPPIFGGDPVLALTNGEADLGNINFLISSPLSRTGKFKMGVEIKNAREKSVQEGITSPFVVRVRLGEELCHHPITSLDELHRMRIELSNQVCGALGPDSLGIIRPSPALHDRSDLSNTRKRKVVIQEDDKDEDNSDPHTTKSLKRIELLYDNVHDSIITSFRSQPNQSTRFRLMIENSICTPVYKNERIETEDGAGHIKVIMYDGGSPIAPDHPFASVKVDVVVIEGRFNEPKRDSWSKEEFEGSIVKPRGETSSLVKNGTFDLINGSCNYKGALITENSQRRKVKLGVMIAVHSEVRVLEGVSNPFRVQECKRKDHGNHTKFLTDDTSEDYRLSYPPPTVALNVQRNGSKNKVIKPSPPVPTRNFVQPTSTHATKDGQRPVSPVYSNEWSYTIGH